MPGGADVNNVTTYIGQGFDKNHGIIPGIIYPGQNHITVPTHGTQKVDTYIKVSEFSEYSRIFLHQITYIYTYIHLIISLVFLL